MRQVIPPGSLEDWVPILTPSLTKLGEWLNYVVSPCCYLPTKKSWLPHGHWGNKRSNTGWIKDRCTFSDILPTERWAPHPNPWLGAGLLRKREEVKFASSGPKHLRLWLMTSLGKPHGKAPCGKSILQWIPVPHPCPPTSRELQQHRTPLPCSVITRLPPLVRYVFSSALRIPSPWHRVNEMNFYVLKWTHPSVFNGRKIKF